MAPEGPSPAASFRAWKLFLPILPALLPGCIAVLAVGAGALVYGGIRYHENGAHQDFNRSLQECWEACRKALRKLHHPFDETKRPGRTEGELQAGEVRIRVERHPGNRTRILVKVGTFKTRDHQRRARLILEEIQRQF